eukprot:GHVU01064845.1.p1 GENE.GHVU01064845.1~~GHVU01064845.1.p1  ORF type:complete len:108 (+),score=5.93 GHVU01064845.1:26-349(+)
MNAVSLSSSESAGKSTSQCSESAGKPVSQSLTTLIAFSIYSYVLTLSLFREWPLQRRPHAYIHASIHTYMRPYIHACSHAFIPTPLIALSVAAAVAATGTRASRTST